jgi:hypothetical protein
MRKPFALLFAFAAVPLIASAQIIPTYAVGAAQIVPVPSGPNSISTWYFNDSVFPYVYTSDGVTKMGFFGAGAVYRYSGVDMMHLEPSPGQVKMTRAPGVDGSWENAYDANGDWMLTATRAGDGTLVGFVHGENHQFSDGVYGEWNSSGVWTSTDDGKSWMNWGVIVGSPKPTNGGVFGGAGLSEVIWDARNNRWIGYGANQPYVSYDMYAKPGTWFGMDSGGNFTIQMDPTRNPIGLTSAPGLTSSVTWGGLSYNTHINEYIMTWMPFGDTHTVYAAFSKDCLHWSAAIQLFSEDASHYITYPSIIGPTDTSTQQDTYLIYERTPPTGPNRNDIVRRTLNFK